MVKSTRLQESVTCWFVGVSELPGLPAFEAAAVNEVVFIILAASL